MKRRPISIDRSTQFKKSSMEVNMRNIFLLMIVLLSLGVCTILLMLDIGSFLLPEWMALGLGILAALIGLRFVLQKQIKHRALKIERKK